MYGALDGWAPMSHVDYNGHVAFQRKSCRHVDFKKVPSS